MPLGNLTTANLPSILHLNIVGNSETLSLWSVRKVVWGFQTSLCGSRGLEEKIKSIFGVPHLCGHSSTRGRGGRGGTSEHHHIGVGQSYCDI